MKRRDFFTQATMAAGAPMMQAAQVGTKPAIKITDIKTHFVGVAGRNFCFVSNVLFRITSSLMDHRTRFDAAMVRAYRSVSSS